MKQIVRLLKNGFASSSGLTPEFKSFAVKFQNAIKKELPEGASLVNYNRGHFYVYGFIKLANEKLFYFSLSDVRFFTDSKLLLRTAKHEKDYTGGTNNYVELKEGSLKRSLEIGTII